MDFSRLFFVSFVEHYLNARKVKVFNFVHFVSTRDFFVFSTKSFFRKLAFQLVRSSRYSKEMKISFIDDLNKKKSIENLWCKSLALNCILALECLPIIIWLCITLKLLLLVNDIQVKCLLLLLLLCMICVGPNIRIQYHYSKKHLFAKWCY